MQAAALSLSAEAEIDDVRDMLDRMPRLSQGTDHPIENIMTTYVFQYVTWSPSERCVDMTLRSTLVQSLNSLVAPCSLQVQSLILDVQT
jgi:hypothetical protein